ncbi:MAG: CcmD family protein [Chloroflexi bacterium]|nr:CcmD family protein [Chloroflexota bacterium]
MKRILTRPLTILLAIVASVVPATAALAATNGPIFRAAEYVGQENTNTETNLDFLFAIYIITWAGFFTYIFIVSRRQRTMERDIKALKQLLSQQQGTGRASSAE